MLTEFLTAVKLGAFYHTLKISAISGNFNSEMEVRADLEGYFLQVLHEDLSSSLPVYVDNADAKYNITWQLKY